MKQKTDLYSIQGPADGDQVILFVDWFDPPTMDHVKAAEVLASHGKWVWLCPLAPMDEAQKIKDMVSILAADLKASGKETSICTAALDKKLGIDDLLAWTRSKFPRLTFTIASLKDDIFDKKGTTLCVRIGKSGCVVPAGGRLVPIENCLAVPVDVRKRIADGSDESRHIAGPVWNYIQKHRLYREAHHGNLG